MSWDWGNALEGMVGGGASGGLAGGPGGAIGGGILGLISGGMTQDPKSADELGIKPLDLKAEAQDLMPTEGELNSRREGFSASLDGEIDRYKSQLIATGVDPAQATKMAQNRFMANRNRYMSSEQSSLANMERGIMSSMMPAKMQRDEDILNLKNANDSAPGVLQSWMPAIAGAGMSNMGGEGGSAWENFGDFLPSMKEHGVGNVVKTWFS